MTSKDLLKKKNLIAGAIALALAATGLYFIFRGTKPKVDQPTPPKPPEPSNGGVGGGYTKFTVNTLSSPLNVRRSPTTASDIVTTLPKGSTIFAKPSGTTGWYEYSSDGRISAGFVSSLYIKAV